MTQEQQNQLFLMMGEIRATQTLILEKLAEHIEDDKILAQDVKYLSAKVNKAAAILSLASIFIGAVFTTGLKKLGIIS